MGQGTRTDAGGADFNSIGLGGVEGAIANPHGYGVVTSLGGGGLPGNRFSLELV